MEPKKNIIFCGVLTISDRCAAGITEDLSGPNLQKVLQEYPGITSVVKMRKIVADEIPAIKDTLIDWCDKEKLNLILTTGGTGISPRDVTPEATGQVIEKELNAIVIGIIAASLAKTRYSMLTRMKCGIRGKTLIINFPGSKRVAEECLRFILPVLNHANDVLCNNLNEVDSFHRAADASLEKSLTRPQVSTSSTSTPSVVLPDIRQTSVGLQQSVRAISPSHHVLPAQSPISLDSHVYPAGSHTISPDSHVYPAGSHTISPDSHVIGGHTISPDSHVISRGHVYPPDSHTIPLGGHHITAAHVYPANAHVISEGSHIVTPDAHTITMGAHSISADIHGLRPNAHGMHHVSSSQQHVILNSEAVDLNSDTIERELQARGLLELSQGDSTARNGIQDSEEAKKTNPAPAKARTPPPVTSQPVNAVENNLVRRPEPYSIAMEKIALSMATAVKRKPDDEFWLPTKVAKRDRESRYPLIPLDQATATVLENASLQPIILVPYEDALGFVVAEDIIAPESIPQFPASIKDGYAVIAADTPGELRVIGSSIYGVPGPGSALRPGETIRITTGSPVPAGADAIVQVEDTKLLEDAKGGEIEVRIAVTTGVEKNQDIRPVGSDIKQGECVLRSGICLGPSEIGILASLGIGTVKVYKKPVVAVMSTGNEITEPGTGPLEVGQVRDSNRKTLLSYLKQAGFETVDIGIVRDDPNKIRLSLESAFEIADVVVTSGGVSVGERDFLKYSIKSIGGLIHFGRVLMKPGKPTSFGTVNTKKGKKLVFALPGNPVSSAVTFNLFTLPALKKMSGFSDPSATVIKARAGCGIKLDPRPEFQRCSLTWKEGDCTPVAETTGNQISSRLTSMVSANALVVLPPRGESCTEIRKGDLVGTMVIDSL